jgi:hypothetical protein
MITCSPENCAQAILGNVDIYDLTPDALYYHIAEIRGEKLVEFTLETFSKKEPDFPGYDSLIHILSTLLCVCACVCACVYVCCVCERNLS